MTELNEEQCPLSVSLSLSLSLFLSLCPSLFLCLSLYLSLTLSLCLSPSLCLSLHLSLSLSVSVYICIYIFIYVYISSCGFNSYIVTSTFSTGHFRPVVKRGSARAEDAPGTPTQSHVSLGILSIRSSSNEHQQIHALAGKS